MKIIFSPSAWENYLYWQQENKKMTEKINRLIHEITRTPFKGSGKPELLKHRFRGKWSRRISTEHRLVYSVIDETLTIYSCRFHY